MVVCSRDTFWVKRGMHREEIARKNILTVLLLWGKLPMTEDQRPYQAYGVLDGYLLPVQRHEG